MLKTIPSSLDQLDILLFGGAFDPPHLGHTTVVEQVLTLDIAKKVIIMPVGQHPFDKELSSPNHRLQMVQRAFAKCIKKFSQRCVVSRYELDQATTTYSIDTIKHELAKYTHRPSIGILIGSDNVASFPRWYNSDEILQIATVLIYPREGYKVDPNLLLPGMVLLEEVSQVVCSSSAIKKMFAYSKMRSMLDEAVFEYIIEHGLYSENMST